MNKNDKLMKISFLELNIPGFISLVCTSYNSLSHQTSMYNLTVCSLSLISMAIELEPKIIYKENE